MKAQPNATKGGDQRRGHRQRAVTLLPPAHLQHDVGAAEKAHRQVAEHMDDGLAVVAQQRLLLEQHLIEVRAAP
jgi:hypothetical protein